MTPTVRAALAAAWLLAPAAVLAQDRPGAAVEVAGGWAGFVDERLDHHGVVGAAARVFVAPGVSLGPELLYMKGGRGHRDLALAGSVMVDVSRPDAPVTWFLVGSVGALHQKDEFGAGRVTSVNEFFTAGVGARVPVTEAVYLAPDLRLGSELHWQATVSLGIRRD